jgi:hypothetical protein
MNFKTTYVLFGFLAVVLIVLAIGIFIAPGDTEKSSYVLSGMHSTTNPFKEDDVDRVEIQRLRPEAPTIVLVRDPETKKWSITEPRAMRAENFTVNDLVRQLYDAHREEEVDLPSNLKAAGLETPTRVITLKKGSEREEKLTIGEMTTGKDSAVVYVLSSDRPKELIAIKKNSIDTALKDVVAFRSRDLLSASSTDIQAITLSQGKKAPLELKKTTDGRWQYVKPPYGDAEVDGSPGDPGGDKAPTGVQSLLTDISNLRVDYRADNDNDFVADDVKDLAKYNLDPSNPDVLRIEIQRSETGGKTATAALLVGVSKKVDDKSDKYYARLDGENTVVKVDAKSVQPLLKLLDDPEALRNRTLVDIGNFRQPDALNIKNSWGTLEFRRPDPNKPWKLYRGDKAVEIKDDSVKSLITLLTQKGQVRSFADPKQRTQLGLDHPEVVVSLWVDGLASEEKKDEKDEKEEKKDKKEKSASKEPPKPKLKDPEKPTFLLNIGNPEGDLVAVERKRADDKETVILKVPDLIRTQLKQSPLAYFDKELPQFNPGAFDASQDVTKIVVEHGGTTYEVTRAAKDSSTWKIEKPTDLAGRNADPKAILDILNSLNRLRAVRLVAEKADPTQLDREFGLKTPQAKAIVTVTKKEKDGDKEKDTVTTYEYAFGKETEDKSGIYGKQSQRDMIFVVDKGILTTLSMDLQDPTVLRFEVPKVKKVKITGWESLFGRVETLEAERKDASQWQVLTPKDFTLDASKLSRLLQDLSSLRAERFVSRKTAPKPEYELEVSKGALQIELTIEGEKEPVVVTVGKQDGDKGYFALVSKVREDVIEVRKDIFEGPKSKPAFFKP